MPAPITDKEMVRRRFGKLVVVKCVGKTDHWRCRCDCGRQSTKYGADLRAQRIRSCGRCSRQKPDAVRRHPLYPIWNSMMTRCYNRTAKDYPRYGGAGVTVCRRWHTFKSFVADMSPRPTGLQLERRHNSGPYSPSNCYWASVTEQARNR